MPSPRPNLPRAEGGGCGSSTTTTLCGGEPESCVRREREGCARREREGCVRGEREGGPENGPLARTLPGDEPLVSFEEGLRRTVEWYRTEAAPLAPARPARKGRRGPSPSMTRAILTALPRSRLL